MCFVRTGFAGTDWLDHFYRTDKGAIEFAWKNISHCDEVACPLATEHECPANRLTPPDKESTKN